MTPNDFVNHLIAAPNGLGSLIAVTVRARALKVETRHALAASAVELLAGSKGLKILRTLTDDGMHVVGLKGFGK